MGKKLPKIITQEEFEKLLSYTIKKKVRHYKLKAICMLLGFEAGMRISEIVGLPGSVPALTKDKVSMERNHIFIQSGKGDKDRIVPLPKRFKASYLDFLPIKLGRRALQSYITITGKKVLEKDISFHTLRHGFATNLVNRGMPIHEIQMLMGHSRLDTTGIYLRADPRKAIERAREMF